jgi:hypothetical protein
VLGDLSGVISFLREMESAIDEAEVQVSRVCQKEKRGLRNQQNHLVYRKCEGTKLLL